MRELRRMGIVTMVVNNKTVTHEVLSREAWGLGPGAWPHLTWLAKHSTAWP